jgi:hypothetical protein
MYSLVLVDGTPDARNNETRKRQILTSPGSMFLNELARVRHVNFKQPMYGMLERPGLKCFEYVTPIRWKWNCLV